MTRSRHSHYTPIPGLEPLRHYGPPGSNSLTQFEMPSPNVISKSRPRGIGGTRKKGVFGKSIGEKKELRRANRGGKRSGRNNKKFELEVEDMEVTVKKNNLTQHQSTYDSELLSESASPEKELDIMEDNKMDVDEDSDATQPLDTQPNDGAEFHFDEDEVGKNDVHNGGIDEDEDDTDVDSGMDDNASVESELGSRRLFPKSTVKKKNNSSNRRVIKDEESEEEEEDDVDMDVDTKKQKKKKSTKGKSNTQKNTNPRRKKTSGAKDDTSDEETDYEDGKENSTAAKRGLNTTDTTSGKRRSERLKSNKPINLDESRFSEDDSENELDSEDENITYSTRRVKGDKKRGGGKSSKHGKSSNKHMEEDSSDDEEESTCSSKVRKPSARSTTKRGDKSNVSNSKASSRNKKSRAVEDDSSDDDDTMTSKGSEIVKSKASSSKTRAKVHPKKTREDFLAKARLEAEEEAEEAAAKKKKKKSKDSKAKNSRHSAAEKKKATKKKSEEYDSDDYEGDDTTVVYSSDEEEASDPEDEYQPTQKEGRVAKEVAERSVRPTRTSARTANKGKKLDEEPAKVDQATTAKTTGRRRKKGQAKKGRADMGLDMEDEEFSLGSNERVVAPKGRGSSKAKPSSKSTNNGKKEQQKKRKSSSEVEEASIDPTKSGRKMKKSKSLKKKEESALELDKDMDDVAAAAEKSKSRRSSKSKQAKPAKAADKKKETLKEDDDDIMSDGEEESKSINTDLQVEYTNEEEEDDDDTATFYQLPLTQAPAMTQYMQSESQESEVTVQTKGSKKVKSVTLDTRELLRKTAKEACDAVNKLGTQAQTQMSSTISPDGTKASTKNSLAGGGGESTTSKSNVSFANDGGQEYDDEESQSKDSEGNVAEAMKMLVGATKLLVGATKLLGEVQQDRA